MTYTMKMLEVRKEGRREGLQEGMQKGMQRKEREMVKSLLLVGTPVEYICKATGWTEDAVYRFMYAEPPAQ